MPKFTEKGLSNRPTKDLISIILKLQTENDALRDKCTKAERRTTNERTKELNAKLRKANREMMAALAQASAVYKKYEIG